MRNFCTVFKFYQQRNNAKNLLNIPNVQYLYTVCKEPSFILCINLVFDKVDFDFNIYFALQ